MRDYCFYVYIMFNQRNGTIYVGITNDIVRRVMEHKSKKHPKSFTARYNCTKLGYFEKIQYVNDAIDWEKKLKSKSRQYKIKLIESINPDWVDLSAESDFWWR